MILSHRLCIYILEGHLQLVLSTIEISNTMLRKERLLFTLWLRYAAERTSKFCQGVIITGYFKCNTFWLTSSQCKFNNSEKYFSILVFCLFPWHGEGTYSYIRFKIKSLFNYMMFNLVTSFEVSSNSGKS